MHRVGDLSLGGDTGRVRTDAAPRVLSGLRNTVLYVLRATGSVRIAEALRHLAARPEEAVHRVMQPLPTELGKTLGWRFRRLNRAARTR